MEHTTAGNITQQKEDSSQSKTFTITAHISRVVLGLIFLVFGLNGIVHFIPMSPPSGKAGEFLFGLVKSQYFLPLMAFIQLTCGALLLSGSLIPFTLLVLFPISLNIFFFHLALAPSGLGMAVLILAMHILLAVYYWPSYKQLFKAPNAWKTNFFT